MSSFLSPYVESIITFTGINVIMAFGLFLPLWAGQFSIAHAAFMAIGAYSSAILTKNFGFPFPVAFIIGSVSSGLIGVIFGFPAIRIRGLYLAIVTLGLSEIVRVFFLNFKYTGAQAGFAGIPMQTRPYMIYAVIIILIIFFLRLTHSRIGRAFEAIREEELAAEVIGVNLIRVKLLACGLGGFICGMAGVFFAHYTSWVTSEQFGFNRLMEIVFFVFIGGTSNFWGPFFGASLLTVIPEISRFTSEWRLILIGLLQVIIILIRPEGLITKNIITTSFWVSNVKMLMGKFSKILKKIRYIYASNN